MKLSTHILSPLLFFAISAVPCTRGLAAETANSDINWADMSLDDLLKVKIKVATKDDKSETNLRTSPAIVTLVTSDEIKKSGARELKDVLQLVPGFYFGTNDTGVIGMGSRGHWTLEGKALLLIDGIEMMDLHSGSLQFGNHYSVEQIDRIEIIRGPGSAIYGGSAELAVINIVTKSGQMLNGSQSSVTYGQMKSDYARKNLALAVGKKINEDFQFSLSSALHEGQRSDRTYTDFSGNELTLKKNSDLNTTMVNLGMNYRKFEFRGLMDLYHTTSGDSRSSGANFTRGQQNDLDTYAALIKYHGEAGPDLSLEPYYSYKWNEPWKTLFAGMPFSDYWFTYTKTSEGMVVNYQLSPDLKFLSGFDFSQLKGVQHTGTFATTGSDTKTLSTGSGYIQTLLSTSFANFNFGARYEASNASPAAVVPRLGVTKIVGDWHFKALYGEGYKSPSLIQMEYGAPGVTMSPERTRVEEIEVGYQMNDKLWTVVNFYNTSLENAIVYDNILGFKNGGTVATRGGELEIKFRDRWGNSTLGYSYYTSSANDITLYQNPLDDKMTLGFPAHKITSNTNFPLTDRGLQLNPTMIYYSERYGYDYSAATAPTGSLTKFPSMFLANIYLSQDNVFTKGLSVGVGVFNVLDTPEIYPQPYNSGHGPLPETSREILAKLSYQEEI